MDKNTELTGLTVTLLSAFVANDDVRAEDLPGLIAATHKALSALNAPAAEPASTENVPEMIPAVTARKSLASTDYILSMIDGKPYRRRWRATHDNGLEPEQYPRAIQSARQPTRWSLLATRQFGARWPRNLGFWPQNAPRQKLAGPEADEEAPRKSHFEARCRYRITAPYPSPPPAIRPCSHATRKS